MNVPGPTHGGRAGWASKTASLSGDYSASSRAGIAVPQVTGVCRAPAAPGPLRAPRRLQQINRKKNHLWLYPTSPVGPQSKTVHEIGIAPSFFSFPVCLKDHSSKLKRSRMPGA